MSAGRQSGSPRPLPQGWRFEPADVVGAMADAFPEWACWLTNQNAIWACAPSPYHEGRGAVFLTPEGFARAWPAWGTGPQNLALPGSGPVAAADVARWAVGVASGGGDANDSSNQNQR